MEIQKVELESMTISLGAVVGMTILFVIFKYQILRRLKNLVDSAVIVGHMDE